MSEIELIAMCNCPEIQDKWEPKVGDKCFTFDKIIRTITEFKKVNEKVVKATLHGIDGYYEIIFSHDIYYIPRVDDVLEWLVNFIPFLDSSHPEGWEAGAGPQKRLIHASSTPLKASLKVYMDVLHDKYWDGSVWHK